MCCNSFFIYLQEVHCNDRFVLHGWQPRPAYNPSTPNNGMCHYYSPYSFSGRVRMLISLTKGLQLTILFLHQKVNNFLCICSASAKGLSSFSDELLPVLERLEHLKEVKLIYVLYQYILGLQEAAMVFSLCFRTLGTQKLGV